MVIKRVILALLVSVLCLESCKHANHTNDATATNDTITHSERNEMKSYISMVEIPVTDIVRAIEFYQTILDIQIERMNVEGMQMGVWPYEGQTVTAVLMKADGYKPSADGVTIYLNVQGNLQAVIDRIAKNGGQILVPKTAHADGSGYFAIFLDSEGNKMALNSPN